MVDLARWVAHASQQGSLECFINTSRAHQSDSTHQSQDLCRGQQLAGGRQLHALRGHAVQAAQVAALRQRYAQVAVPPPAIAWCVLFANACMLSGEAHAFWQGTCSTGHHTSNSIPHKAHSHGQSGTFICTSCKRHWQQTHWKVSVRTAPGSGCACSPRLRASTRRRQSNALPSVAGGCTCCGAAPAEAQLAPLLPPRSLFLTSSTEGSAGGSWRRAPGGSACCCRSGCCARCACCERMMPSCASSSGQGSARAAKPRLNGRCGCEVAAPVPAGACLAARGGAVACIIRA